MKFVKVFSAMATVAILAACSNATANVESKAAGAMPTITDKTVVYSCNKKTVTAVYQFEGQEPTGAMVMVGNNKVIAKDFARDASQKDFTAFTSGNYVWNVDSGLTLDKFGSVVPVNLLQKGKKADKIIVKNCDVNAKATAKANQ